ncbi:hypothetical protein AX14_003212 [Amanita brunnescens Koide BX004]|nr:hypothetical protein AX14_003212 [Amanita brunnescens Koide BX004]
MGVLYDPPPLLLGYGGPLFKHVSAKLVQQNIMDISINSLIAPWEEYKELHTRTVVLMKVSLHTYMITYNDKFKKVCPLVLSHIDSLSGVSNQDGPQDLQA